MRGRPSDSACTLAAALLLTGGVGGWSAGKVQPAVALALVFAGLVATSILLRRQNLLHRRLAALLPDAGPARSTPQLLDALARKLALVDHRAGNTHPVTRLPTREQLLETMAADLAGKTSEHLLGLLHFADFDHLLVFDEAAAHLSLARIGERIGGAAQDRHFVSQVDRATFAIWFGTHGAREEFEAIAYVARQQIVLTDTILTPTINCSTACSPQDAVAPGRLLARATAALSAPVSAPVLGASSADGFRDRFNLEQDLARAIEQDQLTMVFQPVIDLSANRLVGAEALLRWDHPTLGKVAPDLFIPMVERLGLGERYGLWVLNAACREAARWRTEALGDLRMAVNLSAQQVLDPALEAKIDRTLERHGLQPRALELELTETAAMADADRTFQLFTRLRAKGIGLAIDDFGTGYSSLSYLKNLPFTKLKIDREFVTDVDTRRGSRAICKALIELGRGLGLVVLAEGTETASEVDTLRALGCSVFQGFHFSRPLTGHAFVRFARQSLHARGAASLSHRSVVNELSA